MIRTIILIFAVLLILCSPAVLAEEPVSTDGFIEITDDVLDTLDVLENNARSGNFNQLRNPVIQEKFDKVRAGLDRYEGYAMESVSKWPEGPQKEIASELQEANFLYRAYSLSEHNKFRDSAEDSLQKARALYRNYVRHAKLDESG